MFYYELAIIGANIPPLSYHSKIELQPGQITDCKLANKNVKALVLKQIPQPSFDTKECIACGDFFTPLQFALNQFISEYYACNIGLSASLFAYSSGFIEQKNTSAIFKSSTLQAPSKLSPVQQKVFEQIADSRISKNLFLLFGDTGSGKTEIYIHAIAHTLAQGKQVLFLMPEISLTPQMCERISKHFNYGIWHSKITKTAKEQVLRTLKSGEIKLILGARSALFLPWENLGLIIVDEEHDSSYKSSRYPCINARDLALYVGAKSGAKVILGSATPSMASFYNDNLIKLRLRGTYFASEKSVIFNHTKELLSDELIDEILHAHAQKKVSLLFLPLRANFRQVVCSECASIQMCPRCSVALSLHGSIYKCHYCNYKRRFNATCENCGATMLQGRKIGTAGLAQELQNILAERGITLNIARLDSDEASSAKRLKEILKNLESGQIDVLIGTQMIAKGHDYHNIAFVGILGLDNMLNYPEFAAREQTLALAIQVAGRAGRAGHARVMICSVYGEFFAKYMGDFGGFLHDEAALRQFYPPFKRLLRLVIESKNEQEAEKICNDLSEHLIKSKQDDSDYELVGFGPCPITKIGNLYRYNVLLRSSKKMLLSRLATNYKALQKVTIDIDPVNFS